jgi:CubicO group peptidase (beta-lactamase class C family)
MSLLDSLLIDETWNNKTKIATNKDIINVYSINKPTLLFEPNEKWQYSNTGYALLASIIEKASGITYAEFLKKEIFEPLKMNNTFIYTRRAKPRNIKNYAFGYVYSDSLKTNLLPDEINDLNYVYSLDGIVGDGTVNSTIIDLLKWDKALYKNNLVKEKSLEEIFQSSILNDKALTKYGFGWNIEANGLYGKIAYHGGSWPGYKTYIERHLDNEKLIILLQNNDNQNIWFPTKQVREILYDIKPISYIELKKEKLKSLEGEYKFINKDLIRKISFKNNILYVEIYGDEMELKPISQNKFHLIGFSPDVFFEFINKKNVEMLIESQPEMKVLMEAVKK